MENQIQQISVQQGLHADEKISAYNPKWYAFIGFVFGLIPVFVMSSANCRVFSNGEQIKSRMKVYMWIYILGCLALIAVDFWLTYDLYINYPKGGCVKGLKGTICSSLELPNQSEVFINTVDYSRAVFFGFNLIILGVIYKFTRAIELPVYIQLKEKGQINARKFFMPVLAGIILPVFFYFLLPEVLENFGGLVG